MTTVSKRGRRNGTSSERPTVTATDDSTASGSATATCGSPTPCLLIEPNAALAYEAELAQESAEASVRAIEAAQAKKGGAGVQADLPIRVTVGSSGVPVGSAATGTPGIQVAKPSPIMALRK
jgi:hypothetical protein